MDHQTVTHSSPDPKRIVSYIVGEILSLAGMGVALFWSAGRVDWWAGWGAMAVMLGWLAATAVIILRFNPALLAERLDRHRGGKSWDTAIVSILGLLQLIRYILAGLDQRYDWTGGLPLAAQILAWFFCALGYALFTWATASNAFYSRIIRIQTERGHTVVQNGPYRYIRHPGYLGAIVYELAVSILLASWWSLIPSGVNAVLLIVRTALEDRTLQAELPGYKDYTRRTTYRLLPGLW